MDNMKVLCLDDNKRHLLVVSKKVEEKGHLVYPATEVVSAFEILRNHNIDCIVIDYELEDKEFDGVSFIVKAQTLGYSKSVIFVTSKKEIYEKSSHLVGDIRIIMKTQSYGKELSANLHNCFSEQLKKEKGSYWLRKKLN